MTPKDQTIADLRAKLAKAEEYNEETHARADSLRARLTSAEARVGDLVLWLKDIKASARDGRAPGTSHAQQRAHLKSIEEWARAALNSKDGE